MDTHTHTHTKGLQFPEYGVTLCLLQLVTIYRP